VNRRRLLRVLVASFVLTTGLARTMLVVSDESQYLATATWAFDDVVVNEGRTPTSVRIHWSRSGCSEYFTQWPVYQSIS